MAEYYTEDLFTHYKALWKDETAFLSSTTRIHANPHYQAIIRMGLAVVPLMLEDMLRYGPNHWFYALTKITGENPLRPEEAGNMTAHMRRWVEWGIDKGHVVIPKQGELYEHYKGNRYRIFRVSKHADTEESTLLYHLDGNDTVVWPRSTAIFLESIDLNGSWKKRFTLIPETS